MADLATAETKVIYTPPAGQPYSKDLWAPEIHSLNGRWYIYFSADSLNNLSHRVWVIENPSPDPMQGEWTMKGKIGDAGNHWEIDMSVMDYNGQLYAAWSGWEGSANGRQDIYIAKLKNPWTLDGDRVKISQPDSVIPIECSNCADSVLSRVTAVQPSSSIFTSGRPMLIIGSMVKNMPGRNSGPVPGRPAWTTSGASWNNRPSPCPQKSRTTP